MCQTDEIDHWLAAVGDGDRTGVRRRGAVVQLADGGGGPAGHVGTHVVAHLAEKRLSPSR